jgi:RNA polymerase sigma-70 factor (ECF subfamily)
VIAAQVFPAIGQLPESLRLALVAVDVAGLSYGEAARLLGAPEATITTRLHRARRLVARELDPERFAAGRAKGSGEGCSGEPMAA